MSIDVMNDSPRDWQSELSKLAIAHGGPKVNAQIKARPEDFRVLENLQVVPSGAGEHYWLHISKTKRSTDQVAKELAKFTKVSHRDVGYSGIKDFFAITDQWFSVWMPGAESPDWNSFDLPGVRINKITQHARKIKRGTHKSNFFEVQISGIDGTADAILQTVELIKEQGVPNYFGPQRFGNNADNMNQVMTFFNSGKRSKNRNLHGLLLSSARSWIFNKIVSARVEQGSWQSLLANEPACLAGSNSMFISENAEDEIERLLSMDIHPSAPMWGRNSERLMLDSKTVHDWELEVIANEQKLCHGLERAGLEYQRRPIRSHVRNLSAKRNDRGVVLSFELQRGQFATSVLRELV